MGIWGKAKAAAMALLPLAVFPAMAEARQAAEPPLYAGRLEPFHGKSLEQKVQELADREEIRELIAAYAHRVAHGLPIADLFTDDGVFINIRPGQPPSEARGRAALDARFGSFGKGDDNPLPMIHNHLVRIDGDEARGICSNELRLTENGKSIIASAYYEDRLRRENGRWRFAERRVTFFHWVPLQEGWAKPAAMK